MAELLASALRDGEHGSAYGTGQDVRPAPPGRLAEALALGGVGAGAVGAAAGPARMLRR